MISEREVYDEVVTATAALELQTGLVRAEIFTGWKTLRETILSPL